MKAKPKPTPRSAKRSSRSANTLALPEVVAQIGRFDSAILVDFQNHGYSLSNRSAVLYVSADRRTLWIVPPTSTIRRAQLGRATTKFQATVDRAVSAFKAFMGFDAHNARTFDLANKAVQLTSYAVSELVYKSDKWTGRSQLYRHKFSRPALCYQSADQTIVAIRRSANSPIICDRGVIG
jgi:peptidoglycan hydrolase-like protein with peptidoglycan-binding domain